MEGEPRWQRSRTTERPPDATEIAQSIARWRPDPFYGFIIDRHTRSLRCFLPGRQSPTASSYKAGPQTDACWSPDGREIAFSTSSDVGRDRNSTIRILDVASQRVTTLPGSVGMFSPRWSPDGKSIAADAFDVSSIRVFNTKTQQWSTIHQGLLGWFLWSKDSQSMFLLKYTEDPGVYQIPIKGGKEMRIVDRRMCPPRERTACG